MKRLNIYSNWTFFLKIRTEGFSGGPLVRIQCFYCRVLGSIPGSGTKNPQANLWGQKNNNWENQSRINLSHTHTHKHVHTHTLMCLCLYVRKKWPWCSQEKEKSGVEIIKNFQHKLTFSKKKKGGFIHANIMNLLSCLHYNHRVFVEFFLLNCTGAIWGNNIFTIRRQINVLNPSLILEIRYTCFSVIFWSFWNTRIFCKRQKAERHFEQPENKTNFVCANLS